jgi:hypothetical protein
MHRILYRTNRGFLLASLMVLLALTLVVSNRASSMGQGAPTGPGRFVDNKDGTVADCQVYSVLETETLSVRAVRGPLSASDLASQ